MCTEQIGVFAYLNVVIFDFLSCALRGILRHVQIFEEIGHVGVFRVDVLHQRLLRRFDGFEDLNRDVLVEVKLPGHRRAAVQLNLSRRTISVRAHR